LVVDLALQTAYEHDEPQEDENPSPRSACRFGIPTGDRHADTKLPAEYHRQLMNAWRRVALLAALAVGAIGFEASASDLPLTFEGYFSSASNLFFRMRLTRADGTTVDTWRRVGESVADFQLVRFDGKTQALVVRDVAGRESELTLPEGRVRGDERLSDEEFKALRKYIEYPREPQPPVLSRQMARAFWRRMNEEVIEKFGPLPPGVALSFDSSGLPEEGKIRFDSAEKASAERGGRIFVARNADRFGIAGLPMNPFQLPESFTRNLTPDDWDELATLSLLAISGDFWSKGNMY
jgi:hypothetical protein